VTAALSFLGYAAAVAWCAPVLLARLTASGASVRPGLAAWLSAMASALTAAALGAAAIARTAAAQWPVLTRLLCHGVAGSACTPQVYRSMAYSAGVTILAILVTLTALAALWRYGRRTQRAVTRTRMHARGALLAGRALAGTGAVVLDDPRPAAYCVAGRPAAIVVTTGALGVLDDAQLAAVLAHERAHLASRHHLLATVTRGLAAAFPRVPLFTAGTGEVTRLTELAADATAARTAGRGDLVTALLAIATGTAVTGASVPGLAGTAEGVLAAAADAVPARVERLIHPPRPGDTVVAGLVLGLVSAVLVLLPAALAALAG
jgi:Zn-dependent protease with chaperone function